MVIPVKTLNNGFALPVFGLGTWTMGGKKEFDPDNDDKADITAIKTAIELGVTHIDTAQNYAAGHAETLVGKAIQGFDRKNLVLTTKVRKENFRYLNVLSSVEESLSHLQTDYIDLLLLHSPNEKVPLAETMHGLNELVEKKRVLHLGVSNFNIAQMEEAKRLSHSPLVTNQVHYNLQFREMEKRGVLAYCQEHDIVLTAYRPIQKGDLLQDIPEVLEKMCKKYETTPAQIALNWLISQKNVVVISKARSIAHLKENLGAVGWEMASEDVEALRLHYPNIQNVSDVCPLDD